MQRNVWKGLGAGGRSLVVATGLLLAIGLLAGCGGPDELDEGVAAAESAMQDGAVRRQNRPAGVPDDFVATPQGWFHRSCVLEVPEGDSVREDGVVVSADGELRAVRRCEHARFDRRGRRFDRAEDVPPPSVNGWVASVWSMSVGPVKSLSATWRVPAAPASSASQTLYFFPGLEPATTGAFIMQPVLAWNGFDDRRWTIASWNCCTQGNVWHSTPKRVTSGETVSGSVSATKCNAQGVCSSWSIRTASSKGASTTLSTSSYGAVMDWVFAGAFEAYGVDACDQYPASGGITFASLVVRGTDGLLREPPWTPVSSAVEPSCMTSVSADPAAKSASMTWAAP